MLSKIKDAALTVCAFFTVVFFMLFKMRGREIEKQGETIRVAKSNIDKLDSAIETQNETIKQTETANEILNGPNDINGAFGRMYERARACRNSDKS